MSPVRADDNRRMAVPSHATAARGVVIFVYDGVNLLDVAGPAEVFTEANRCGAGYRLTLVSADGSDITSNQGFRVVADAPVAAELTPDTYLVPGSDRYPRAPVPPELIDAVRVPAAGARRVASICTGAFLLAAAGLLDGKRATTHWKVTRELAARCPTCRVEADAIYVRDGHTYTSAGVTAGIDLALALVEEDHGPDLTRDVARALVVYMQRSGGQSQFSAPMQVPPPQSPALRAVTDLVMANPTDDHSLDALAHHLHVSTRQLTRLFREEMSTSPARFVETIRFDLARALLDQGHTATQAAAGAGFPSYESMRRVFARQLGISPTAYRRRFSTARRAASG
jgi:transcriptional regulator GlxA family with amidase domain